MIPIFGRKSIRSSKRVKSLLCATTRSLRTITRFSRGKRNDKIICQIHVFCCVQLPASFFLLLVFLNKRVKSVRHEFWSLLKNAVLQLRVREYAEWCGIAPGLLYPLTHWQLRSVVCNNMLVFAVHTENSILDLCFIWSHFHVSFFIQIS